MKLLTLSENGAIDRIARRMGLQREAGMTDQLKRLLDNYNMEEVITPGGRQFSPETGPGYFGIEEIPASGSDQPERARVYDAEQELVVDPFEALYHLQQLPQAPAPDRSQIWDALSAAVAETEMYGEEAWEQQFVARRAQFLEKLKEKAREWVAPQQAQDPPWQPVPGGPGPAAEPEYDFQQLEDDLQEIHWWIDYFSEQHALTREEVSALKEQVELLETQMEAQPPRTTYDTDVDTGAEWWEDYLRENPYPYATTFL